MKPCWITDNCYWKNPVSFGVDATQNGRTVVIMDFCINVSHMDHMQYGNAT